MQFKQIPLRGQCRIYTDFHNQISEYYNPLNLLKLLFFKKGI
ncbi:hypothetical protein SPONL_1667 [uncultured Candidatus Thioglobus sp.]|nr:hypothetical protein SPONL_1667 [uncultured Candidatus Thioglobus sp.]